MGAEEFVLPRLIKEADAARYIGVGTTTLRGLRIPRKMVGSRRFVYDRHDLDSLADDLPVDGDGTAREADEWLDENQAQEHQQGPRDTRRSHGG